MRINTTVLLGHDVTLHLTVHASNHALDTRIPQAFKRNPTRSPSSVKKYLQTQLFYEAFFVPIDGDLNVSVGQIIGRYQDLLPKKFKAWRPVFEIGHFESTPRIRTAGVLDYWDNAASSFGFVLDFGIGSYFEHLANHQDSNLSRSQKIQRNIFAGAGGAGFSLLGAIGGTTLGGAVCAVTTPVCASVGAGFGIVGALGGGYAWGQIGQPWIFERRELNPTYDDLKPLGGN